MKPVAIVTGARRGIGLGIAKKLSKDGYIVVLSARSEDGSDAINELEFSQDALYIACDVTNETDRQKLVETVKQKYGRIDLLVNNAGVAPKQREDILKTTQESYDFVVNTNTRSTFFMTQLVANTMLAMQKENLPDYQPRIVNISSVSAYAVSTERGEYCISKAGISMITQLFAARLAEYNIPVFEIRPGIIQTDMTAKVHEKYQTAIENGLTPTRRFGLPEDVANCVSAVCSGALDFSTGQVLNADGGFHIHRL